MIVQDDTLIEVIHELNRHDVIALDTETNITDMMHDRYVLGFSASTATNDYYFPIQHINHGPHVNLSDLGPLVSLKPRHIIWHNAKFDRQVFKILDMNFDDVSFEDTMLLSYVLDENPPHTLKELGELHVTKGASIDQQIVKILSKGFSWEGIPLEIMAQYARMDTRLTYDLYYKLAPMLTALGDDLIKIYYDDIEFCKILQEIEEVGIRIDTVEARLKAAQCLKLMSDIEKELGYDPGKPSQLIPRLFTMPPEGLGLAPLAYGKGSKPSTGVEILEEYHHPEVARVLHYRRIKKAMTSYYQSWPALVDSKSILHPTYHQHSTVTCRLSCSDPNMQQIPRDSDENETKALFPVKKLVRATPGWEVWELDYDQQELRLASVYAKEEKMLKVFRDGGDPHQLMATTLGVTRFLGKQVNFLLPYGGGSYKLFTAVKKLAPNIGFTLQRAESIHQQYHEQYPGFRRIAYRCSSAMEERGYIQYWSGRRRRMQFDQHKAFNSLIQGGCADITREAMRRIRKLDLADTRMISQVHDSIWFETRNRADLLYVKNEMEWPSDQFGLPFSVGMKQIA